MSTALALVFLHKNLINVWGFETGTRETKSGGKRASFSYRYCISKIFHKGLRKIRCFCLFSTVKTFFEDQLYDSDYFAVLS